MRIFILFVLLPFVCTSQLYINEAMSSNQLTLQDEAFEYDDWIEIYNAGQNPVDLQSYFLSDNVSNSQKWEVTESVIIPAGGYVLFWADEDQSQGPTHTNFKISSSGESILLSNPSGSIIDQITVPSLNDDHSFGRITDGSNTLINFIIPSPESSNANGTSQLAKPTISPVSGIYAATQNITITGPAGASFYYTIDGSEPTINSSLYTGPFVLSATQSVRAISVSTGIQPSPIRTNTYLINVNHSLPVFYLTTDSKNLWDDTEGIYVEGTNGITGYCDVVTPFNWNQDWEKPAHLTVFDNGQVKAEHNIGIKISGNCKRKQLQKPLTLIFRDEYSDVGDNEFTYKIFPDNELSKFKRLFVRSGNVNSVQFMKDLVLARMLKNEIDIEAQSGQPAIIYLNDVYMGIQNIREKYDEWHFENDNPKVDKDSIDIIKNPGRYERADRWWALERATEGTLVEWHAFIADIKSKDFSIDSDYQSIKDQINYDELINYLTTGHFFNNTDWIANNQKTWKARGPGNKWVWCLLDLDNALRLSNVADNTLTERIFDPTPSGGTANFESNLLFIKMFENDDFKHEYIQRMNTYIEALFTHENYSNTIDQYNAEMLPDLPQAMEHFNRNLATHLAEIQDEKDFVLQRPPYVRQHISDKFNLTGSFQLTINYDANSNGVVSLHSNYYQIPFNYSGSYFRNIPIEIHAIANPGYRFSHWMETGNPDANLYSSFNTNTSLTPVFVTAEDLVINEIHYNPTGKSESAEFIEIYNPNNVSIDISSYEFEDGICFSFPENTIISGGEYIIIANDATIYSGQGFQVFQWESSSLNNDGEHLSLGNGAGYVIDSLTYNDVNGWASTADNGFYSLALLNHSLDNSQGTAWDVQSQYITPGAQNQFLPYDTYHFPSSLVINELHYFPFDSVTPAGDTLGGKNYEFIEIKNKSNSTVSLTGVALSRGVTFEFSAGSTIPANGFVVIAEDSIQFIERYGFSPFGKYSGKLSNQGELIWLSNGTGQLMDAVRYDEAFPWDTNANGGIEDYSLALIDETKDNNNYLNWKRQCTELQTPNEENDFGCFTGLSYPGLTINEIHYNSNLGNAYEYIEIVNHSQGVLNLKDVSIATGVTFHFEGDIYLPGTAAAPFNYLVIADNANVFENQYGFAPYGEYFGALSNAGERISIQDFFGDVIDEVRYDDVAPWEILADQGQHSLALISGSLDNSLPTSWCTQATGSQLTPKAMNVFGDGDSDGVIDCHDVCPSFDDNLIGTSCDDGDPCTIGESYDTNCNCSGGAFEDADNDGVCDFNDQCPNYDDTIDTNNNGIPDGCEDCSDYIIDMSGSNITQDTSAQIAIVSNGNVQSGNVIEYHAGSEVELTYGFEVESGATFHAFIAPCN